MLLSPINWRMSFYFRTASMHRSTNLGKLYLHPGNENIHTFSIRFCELDRMRLTGGAMPRVIARTSPLISHSMAVSTSRSTASSSALQCHRSRFNASEREQESEPRPAVQKARCVKPHAHGGVQLKLSPMLHQAAVYGVAAAAVLMLSSLGGGLGPSHNAALAATSIAQVARSDPLV